MSEIFGRIPEILTKLRPKKPAFNQFSEADMVSIEPEYKSLEAVVCILTIQTLAGEKIVLVTLPDEDFAGPFTKAETGSAESDLIFLHQKMVAFPSGALDPGEDPAGGIAREMTEENSFIIKPERLTALPFPPIETFQSTVGNSGSVSSIISGVLKLGFGFMRVPKSSVGKPKPRYGYYSFTTKGFCYQLQQEELAALSKTMATQGREVKLLSHQEAMMLGPLDIRPSSRQFLLEYLKLLDK